MEDKIVEAVEGGARTMSDLMKIVEGPRSTILKRAKELAASGRIRMDQGEDATWTLAPAEKSAPAAEPVAQAGSLVGTFKAPALRDGMRRVGTRTFKGPTVADRAEVEARLGFELPMRGDRAMDRNAFLYRLVGEEPKKEQFPLDRLVALFDAIFGGHTSCRHREILTYRTIDAVCSPTAYEVEAGAPRAARPKTTKEPRSIKLSPDLSKVIREAADRGEIEGGADALVFDAVVGFCAGRGWTDLVRALVQARNGGGEETRAQVEHAAPEAPAPTAQATSATP